MEITKVEHKNEDTGKHKRRYLLISGLSLIFAGGLILLDFNLETGWLMHLILPGVGMLFLLIGVQDQKIGLVIAGCLTVAIGVGMLLGLTKIFSLTSVHRIGVIIIAFGLGWIFLIPAVRFVSSHLFLWALVPGMMIVATGVILLITPMRLLDFELYLVSSLGFALLIWGLWKKILGLVVPGCILGSVGPGIYLAWAVERWANSLSKTGVMLVAFAFGWAMITVFSRLLSQKFVWWPLIPSGILAMVGWGLYIGGNPGNAVSFIGNTWSVVIIIFGLYLLLMRSGIRH